MAIVSRTEFGAALGITKGAVNYYVRKGMPIVLGRGVDFDEAKAWVETHIMPQATASKAAKMRAVGDGGSSGKSIWPETVQHAALELATAALGLAGVEHYTDELLIGVANAGLAGASAAAEDLATWMSEARAAKGASGASS